MARKKVVKRKVKNTPSSNSFSVSNRIGIAKKNLVIFILLFFGSLILYNFSTAELFLTFFGILSIILGFLALAFLIAVAVLLVSGKKK